MNKKVTRLASKRHLPAFTRRSPKRTHHTLLLKHIFAAGKNEKK